MSEHSESAHKRERQFKRKARSTFDAALLLARTHPNSAANRAYYCLYQALVAELEYRGVRPQAIDAGAAQAAQNDERLKWTHSFIRNNASLVGLDRRQCALVKLAYELRIEADYRENDVNSAVIEDLLKQVAEILDCLGVA